MTKVKLPPLNCPFVADVRFPWSIEATGEQATLLAKFKVDLAAWRITAKAAIKEGKIPSDFPKSKYVNPNKGRLTGPQYYDVVDRYNDGEKVVIPPRYNPVEVDLITAMECSHIRRSNRQKSPPSDWNEKSHGSWYHKDDDGKRTIASGWVIDKKPPRRCHSDNVLTLIDRPDDCDLNANPNVVTLGDTRYVVGGSKVAESAIFAVRAQRAESNYGHIADVIKRMSLANSSGLTNVVFRIEDHPNHGGTVKVALNGGDEICFMLGQVVTPGYLTNDKGEMTSSAIRKAVETDVSGIKFKALDEIVGNAIPWSDLWPEISLAEGRPGLTKLRERASLKDGGTPQEKSITNAHVMMRTSSSEAFPFGFRSVQLGMVPFCVNDSNGDFSMGIVIGCRDSYEHNVSLSEAKAADREAEEVAQKVKTKVKTKSAKTKTKTKTKAPKVEVEVDTSVSCEPTVVEIDDVDSDVDSCELPEDVTDEVVSASD